MKWRLGMTGVMRNRQRQGFETQDTSSTKSKFLSLGIRFKELSPTFSSNVYLYGGERPPEIDDILNKMRD